MTPTVVPSGKRDRLRENRSRPPERVRRANDRREHKKPNAELGTPLKKVANHKNRRGAGWVRRHRVQPAKERTQVQPLKGKANGEKDFRQKGTKKNIL